MRCMEKQSKMSLTGISQKSVEKEHLLQHVTRGNYKRHVIINEDLVVVFLRQNFVYFNKPYYIGMIQI